VGTHAARSEGEAGQVKDESHVEMRNVSNVYGRDVNHTTESH
jgi:hypothetical protein